RASATGSENHLARLRSTPRSLAFERAHTATMSMARPQRAASASRWRATWAMRGAPTVPNPATPTFSEAVMGSAPRGERDDVVKLLRPGLQEAPDIARGLTDALFVLDQRYAHVAFAVFAEADAGRDRKLRLLDQERGEFDTADTLER